MGVRVRFALAVHPPSDEEHDRNLARAAARRTRAGNAQDDGSLNSAGKPGRARC
jgi:hypothetical protein